MTCSNRDSGRPGVTLIEILVVLAIIGILLALTAAALQKTVEGQNVKTSETQVFKLQQALDQEYERVVAKCAQDATNEQIPHEVTTVCEGNKARAKAVWTAYQLRLAFPETFAEAKANLFVRDKDNALLFTIRPLPVFANANLPSGTFSPEEESGVLLYLILAKRSVSGGGAMATSAEDLTQASRRKAVLVAGNEHETFADAFGRSVGFKRWEATRTPPPPAPQPLPVASYNTNEVQNTPHVDPTKSFAARGDTVNRDPLDPQNVVFPWLNPMVYNTSVTPPTGDARKLIQLGLSFYGQNRMATVYSLGKTKTVSSSNANATPDDDILGFRLRKQGERGHKQ